MGGKRDEELGNQSEKINELNMTPYKLNQNHYYVAAVQKLNVILKNWGLKQKGVFWQTNFMFNLTKWWKENFKSSQRQNKVSLSPKPRVRLGNITEKCLLICLFIFYYNHENRKFLPLDFISFGIYLLFQSRKQKITTTRFQILQCLEFSWRQG